MILRDHGPLDPKNIAAELLRQRDTLRQHRAVIGAVQARVTEYEARFSLPSSEVHGAIDHDTLRETDDVCDWIIDSDLLRRAHEAEGR